MKVDTIELSLCSLTNLWRGGGAKSPAGAFSLCAQLIVYVGSLLIPTNIHLRNGTLERVTFGESFLVRQTKTTKTFWSGRRLANASKKENEYLVF